MQLSRFCGCATGCELRWRADVVTTLSQLRVDDLDRGETSWDCLATSLALLGSVWDGSKRARSDWGSGGRRFKSCQPDYKKPSELVFFIPRDCTKVRPQEIPKDSPRRLRDSLHERPA
jgi:hypothetical protein